jgi:hypothetical protein
MALIALCLPIVPGKKQKWLEMTSQFSKEPLKSKMDAARAAVGSSSR